MRRLMRVMGCPEGVSPEAFALFCAAVELARGMRVLGTSSEDVNGTLWFLRGWVLEYAFKAFLAHGGVSLDTLRQQYGHDLQKLWRQSVAEGLKIDPEAPPYCADHSDMLRRYRQGQLGTDMRPSFGTLVAGDVSELVEDVQRIVDAVGVEMLGDDYRDHEPPTLWAEVEPPDSR